MKLNKSQIKGKPLIPSAALASDISTTLTVLVMQMAVDIRKTLRASLSGTMDAESPVSQARIALNALGKKWGQRFGTVAEETAKRLAQRTLRDSEFSIRNSLKDLSEHVTLDASRMTPDVKEALKAATVEAASLIKAIPDQYLAQVQDATLRSIQGGGSMGELESLLNSLYGQNARKARNTALDQTRKAYSGITEAKCKSLGVRKFVWRHSHGGQHPRKLHEEMDGKIYDMDNPPVIGVMYGQEVRGMPGELPNCRCFMEPVFDFEDD